MKAYNGNNHKQRPYGIVYSPDSVSQKIAHNKVYCIDCDCDIEVLNTKAFTQNEISTISVRYFDDNVTGGFHSEARKLAGTWQSQGNQCLRHCVKGTMKHFGVKLGSGDVHHFAFKSTKHNEDNEFIKIIQSRSQYGPFKKVTMSGLLSGISFFPMYHA
jgi:hypothetical protein